MLIKIFDFILKKDLNLISFLWYTQMILVMTQPPEDVNLLTWYFLVLLVGFVCNGLTHLFVYYLALWTTGKDYLQRDKEES
jgi:hypothetical protein